MVGRERERERKCLQRAVLVVTPVDTSLATWSTAMRSASDVASVYSEEVNMDEGVPSMT